MDGLASSRLVVGIVEVPDKKTSIHGALGTFCVELLESAFRKSLVVNFKNLPEKAIASVSKYRPNPLSN